MSEGIVVTAKQSSAPVDVSYIADEITPIAGLVGLDTHNLNDADKQSIKEIYDFVRGDAKEMTELEMLHKVRELEQKLGMTSIGERRIDKIHRYVKIQAQIQNLEKARDRELR